MSFSEGIIFVGVAVILAGFFGRFTAQLTMEKREAVQKAELERIAKIFHDKNKAVTKELIELSTWLSDMYPMVIITAMFTDPHVQEIRDQCPMKSEEFYSAFKGPLNVVQDAVMLKVSQAYESVNLITRDSVVENTNGH